MQTRSARNTRRRVLSQNFLRGKEAVEWFLDEANLDRGGVALEVGGGEGEISESAAARCRELDVFEIDPLYARKLRSRLSGHRNVRVFERDFLTVRPPDEPFQVIGNVPFSITASVISWCLDAAALDDATFITQLEYARKRTGDYGRWSLLTVRTWPLFSWELRGRISRYQFRPVPRVDAGVLKLTHRSRPLLPVSRMRAYERMIELGFTGVGGSLHASLSTRFPSSWVSSALAAADVDTDRVVGFVDPSQWLCIFERLDARR